METSSYTEILKRVADHDPNAVKLLYERYGQQLYQYAQLQWALDEDAIWEVIYQTLDQLMLRLSSYTFDNQSMFDRFVFKVFLNFLRQRYRKDHNPNRPITVPLTDIYAADQEEGPNEERQIVLANLFTEAQESFHDQDEVQHPALLKLQRALEKLDPVDRDLLLLRAQDFSYDDIARMLKIENNQLKVKYLRAKKKLINLIDQLL